MAPQPEQQQIDPIELIDKDIVSRTNGQRALDTTGVGNFLRSAEQAKGITGREIKCHIAMAVLPPLAGGGAFLVASPSVVAAPLAGAAAAAGTAAIVSKKCNGAVDGTEVAIAAAGGGVFGLAAGIARGITWGLVRFGMYKAAAQSVAITTASGVAGVTADVVTQKAEIANGRRDSFSKQEAGWAGVSGLLLGGFAGKFFRGWMMR